MPEKFSLIYDIVGQYRKLIFDAEEYIWKHPETGFNEWETQGYLADKYEALGYRVNKVGNIPGFTVDIDTGRPGPKLLIFGEMDSLINTNHPDADPATGAVHACGHNAQSAALLGIAAALRDERILASMSGSIRLCAAPAEELLQLGEREELRKKGIIKYYGGKTELMSRGLFRDCDIAFMFHTCGSRDFDCGKGQNGCIVKNMTYEGRASHAGGEPQRGINALYAAELGLSAANSLRETFPDGDHIRFHPIITCGGTAVNAIPDRVCLESYLRGASFDAIRRENRKINRALSGAALAMGANVVISDMPGYTPLNNNETLADFACSVMADALGKERSNRHYGWGTGCTDMGDIAAVMPAIHPHIGGAEGTAHGADYRITDHELACVVSAAGQIYLACELLKNGAEKAEEIIASSKPVFASQDDFLRAVDEFIDSRRRIEYGAEGGALVKI